ncbi:unnamed protein product [Mesocestoides corti]|uniref:Uncharacterized protein n=1 Tax=Mesocestoides corti TaxID=53468 RepID=A0A0R3U3P2_MESCO|nr:unnamed protein product [Mesocestoides corti]
MLRCAVPHSPRLNSGLRSQTERARAHDSQLLVVAVPLVSVGCVTESVTIPMLSSLSPPFPPAGRQLRGVALLNRNDLFAVSSPKHA